MATQRKTAPATEPAPSDPIELLKDIHSRVVRIETRQARAMRAAGLDLEGHPVVTTIKRSTLRRA